MSENHASDPPLSTTRLTATLVPSPVSRTMARRLSLTLFSLVLVTGIGWIDLVTGVDVGLSLLYLVPVAIAGWFAGLVPAVITGLAAGTAWFVAYAPWVAVDIPPLVITWNTLTRFVIYLSQGILLALLRREREVLRRSARRESALARTDVLTGLLNARGFLEIAQHELRNARDRNQPVCVGYIDLDNFKPFNDRLGHAAGDDILIEVARGLRDVIGPESVAARLGGDEFVVLLRQEDVGQAERIGRRIASRTRSIGAIYPDIQFGATVGIVTFRNLPTNVTEMLRLADDVMYAGKTASKGTVSLREL